ncbi:MAG: HAMP domain-containing histidine kinase [Anaerolineae bacterium]|nr:HAMP domain-containing histidine kinase [Anaerolineae bacterium]
MLIIDAEGMVQLLNPRLQNMLNLTTAPQTVNALRRQVGRVIPEFRTLLAQAANVRQTEWGNLRIQQYPSQRVVWQMVPLFDDEGLYTGTLIIFSDANVPGQLEIANQSFLSMISHDFRTPLSTILGFAELLYNNQGRLSPEDQTEFLEHIINNANDLSRYTQIALDIMYLEANQQNFEFESVFLNRLISHWLTDARHRFPAQQIAFENGITEEPLAVVAPAALHRILNILVEFALKESPDDELVDIRLDYGATQAHLVVCHHAPDLSVEDAATLFQLMNPRDLSEMARPHLHRMQLYVASLLAERQDGYLTLRDQANNRYELDLVVPLAAHLDTQPNNR